MSPIATDPSDRCALADPAAQTARQHARRADGPRPARGRTRSHVRLRIVLLALLALVALRLAWGHVACRQLAARIDAYRAAGQPVCVEDLNRPPIPDAENAAVIYEQALVAMRTANVPSVSYDPNRPDLLDPSLRVRDHLSCVREALKPYAQACQLAHDARSRPRCQWPRRFQSPLVLHSSMDDRRMLVKLLCNAAEYDHCMHDDHGCLEKLLDGIAFADGQHDHATLIDYLVVRATGACVCTKTARVAAGLRIARGGIEASRPGPADREQVQALVERLLDEGPGRSAWFEMTSFQRVSQLDTVFALSDGRVTCWWPPLNQLGKWPVGAAAGWEYPIRILLRPGWQLDAAHVVDSWTTVARAGLEADYPTARRVIARGPNVYPALAKRFWLERTLGNPTGLYDVNLDLPERVVELAFKVLAERRLAAVLLAIALYRSDHRYCPATLDELVPRYLAAVPADPFADGGAPLRYIIDDVRPRLYSVGPNAVDEGGYQAPHGRYKDIVYALDGEAPPEQ